MFFPASLIAYTDHVRIRVLSLTPLFSLSMSVPISNEISNCLTRIIFVNCKIIFKNVTPKEKLVFKNNQEKYENISPPYKMHDYLKISSNLEWRN